MANTKLLSKEKGKLSWGQRSYFLFGSTWSFLDKSFPFSSENERETLWKRSKTEVIDLIYLNKSEFPNEWRCPDDSQMRPFEFWLRDAPEVRLFLNDGHTLRETEFEYLSRTGLLNGKDRERIASKSFQEGEEKALAYRKYILETPVRTVQSIPSASTSTERVEIPDVVIHAEAPPQEILPEKPPLPEPAGQCPKCAGRLHVHSPQESICKRCGIVFSLDSLAKLWRGKDNYEREKKMGHKIDGD